MYSGQNSVQACQNCVPGGVLKTWTFKCNSPVLGPPCSRRSSF